MRSPCIVLCVPSHNVSGVDLICECACVRVLQKGLKYVFQVWFWLETLPSLMWLLSQFVSLPHSGTLWPVQLISSQVTRAQWWIGKRRCHSARAAWIGCRLYECKHEREMHHLHVENKRPNIYFDYVLGHADLCPTSVSISIQYW